MSAGPADKALDTFKTLVWDLLVKAAVNRIIALIPFASWGFFSFLSGPLGFVISTVVVKVADILYELLKDGVNLEVILLKNVVHHAEYVKASAELTATFDKYGPDSPQFRKDRDARKASLSKFVRWAA